MDGAMSTTPAIAMALSAAVLAASFLGCDNQQAPSGAPSASSATSEPAPSAAATASGTATASAATVKPSHPCPDESTGEGTFKKPCEAKGKGRLMDVQWTGKMDDKGPSFRVVNNAKLEVIWGNVAVYFYDKAGKQLDVPSTDPGAKPRTKLTCSGGIFGGPMKPAEKAVVYFSCVKKSHVPEGAAAIEAEILMVGFTDDSGKKADTYWRNNDLTPDARPKGGIK